MSSDSHFQCQKCDSPLKLDKSLQNLNNSQLKLLVNTRKNKLFEKANSQILKDLNPEDYIPQDRLEMYEQISDQEPMNRRNYFESEDDEDEEDEGDYNDSGFSSESNSYLVLNESDEFEDTSKSSGNNTKSESQSIDEERDFRMSNRIKTLSTIFSILSNNQDINHPLSEDCANLLIENYKLKFDQSQKEKDNYLLFLKS